MFRTILANLREYCAVSSVPGLSYIANPRFHWTERIFWLLSLMVCTFGAVYIANKYNAIGTTILMHEPAWRTYVFSFPAASLCFSNSPIEYIENYIRNQTSENIYPHNKFLETLIFPKSYVLDTYKNYRNDHCISNETFCFRSHYRQIAEEVYAYRSCNQIFINCSLAGKQFECCRFFQPLLTTEGLCYLFNSHLFPQRVTLPTNFRINDGIHKYSLKVNSSIPITITPLAVTEIPYEYTPHKLCNKRRVLFDYAHQVNDPEILKIPLGKRKCRTENEVIHGSNLPMYGLTGCLLDCVRDIQIKFCNCTIYFNRINFYQEIAESDCDLDGLVCIEHHNLVDLRIRFLLENPLCRLCIPPCNADFSKIIQDECFTDDNHNQIYWNELVMLKPQFVLHRRATFTTLEFVVSVGGILGLFLGVSILTFMELIYFFGIRIWYNRRRNT